MSRYPDVILLVSFKKPKFTHCDHIFLTNITFPHVVRLQKYSKSSSAHDKEWKLIILYHKHFKGIVPVEASSPFAVVTNCEPMDNECSLKYNGKQAFCHKVVTSGVHGICVPHRQFCTTENDCPNIGNLQSGLYSASCSPQGLCAYPRFPILAIE